MKAAVIVNISKQKAIECAEKITALMSKKGVETLMLSECSSFFDRADITYIDDHKALFAAFNSSMILSFPAKSAAIPVFRFSIF